MHGYHHHHNQQNNSPQANHSCGEITVHQAIPARVTLAFDFVRFADSVMSPPTCAYHGAPVCEGRKLDGREQAVYSASLEVLRLYLTGENNYGPQIIPIVPPGMMMGRPPDDDMGMPAPIEVK